MIRRLLCFLTVFVIGFNDTNANSSIKGAQKFIKNSYRTVETINMFHAKNVDFLQPLKGEKTAKEERAIEKSIGSCIRKVKPAPGFWTSFFLPERAEEQERCPFLWYANILENDLGTVTRIMTKCSLKIKKFSRFAKKSKDRKAYRAAADELEDLRKDCLETMVELDALLKFIKQSESYTNELQSRPTNVPQTVTVYVR